MEEKVIRLDSVTKVDSKKSTVTTVQSNLIQSSAPIFEKEKPNVLTAKISIPVSESINIYRNVDDLKLVKVKCGKTFLNRILGTGVQISVVSERLITDMPCEKEGKIEIVSAFKGNKVTLLKIFSVKIDNNLYGNVPSNCAVSRKSVTDLLLSSSAYDTPCESVELCHSNHLCTAVFVERIQSDSETPAVEIRAANNQTCNNYAETITPTSGTKLVFCTSRTR